MMEIQEIRWMPLSELIVQKNYRELVPRPSEEEYNHLKQSIETYGFDPSQPIVTNEELVVLDGITRLTIGLELKKEWGPVTIRDFDGDRQEEQRFIIMTNLLRRHLNTAQRSELGLKLLAIEQEKARERQKQAGEQVGKNNLKQYEKDQVKEGDSVAHQLPQKFGEAGKKGEAAKIVADDKGISHYTLSKAKKIVETAKADPEIAESWEKAKQGQGSVNSVYREVKEKEKREKQKKTKIAKPEPQPLEHIPHDKIMEALYEVTDFHNIPRESIDGAIQMYPDILDTWAWLLRDKMIPEVAWHLTQHFIKQWEIKQRASQPEEIPLPENAKKLGPWALDYVHQAKLQDLVREFPADSIHLIYSDAVPELGQLSSLGEFANRVLKQGKYLCVYVDKRNLPESISRLSASGLTYLWECSASRPPGDKVEIPDIMVRDKWRHMIIYRKGKASEPPWDWFDDLDDSRRPSSSYIVRQLLAGLTTQGQLVVDPFVGSGITGKVSLSLGRRFLCFGADEADVRAANQRISQVSLAESTTT